MKATAPEWHNEGQVEAAARNWLHRSGWHVTPRNILTGPTFVPSIASGPLSNNEIRVLVRKGLADKTLLRQPQVIAGLGRDPVAEVSAPNRCAVCGGKPSQVLYDPDGPRPGPAFHNRCFQGWHEDISELP